MSKQKKSPLYLRIIKLGAIALLIILILYFAVTPLVFNYYKDDLKKSILQGINGKINGEISFSDVSLSQIKYFPDIALDISNVTLKEFSPSGSGSPNDPILRVKDIYLSFGLFELLSSKLHVPRVTLEGGNINVFVLKDSSTNIENLLAKKKTTKITKVSNKTSEAPESSAAPKKDAAPKEKPKQPPAGQQKKKNDKGFKLELAIDRVNISDIKIKLRNMLTGNSIDSYFRTFDTQIKYSPKNISAEFVLEVNIDSIRLKERTFRVGKDIFLDCAINYNRNKGFLTINESKMFLNEAEFNFKGTFDIKNQGDINFYINGKKEINKSILALFLKIHGKENVRSGTAQFDASVKGKLYTRFPEIDMRFAFSGVSLLNPVTKKLIKNLNSTGSFSSGTKSDFSEASLLIDTLYAEFPKGRIKASAKVVNLVSPEVDLNLFLNAETTGLDRIFKMKSARDMKGWIRIYDRYRGKYFRDTKKLQTDFNVSDIKFTDFGINIPGVIKLDKVNGTISRRNDKHFVKDLRIISDDTDLLLNGELSNLNYLFFGAEKDLTAELNIKSPVFNLPDFLMINPYIKKNFPYRILDGELSASVKSNTSNFYKFKSFPEMDFDIHKLKGTAENFLPHVDIISGKFSISEDTSFTLRFDKFRTKFLNGQINFTGVYSTSWKYPYTIKVRTDFYKITPSLLFNPAQEKVSELFKGNLSGSLSAKLQFPVKLVKLKYISLENANLTYAYPKDTISFHNLNFHLADINFNKKTNPDPLATLSAKGTFGYDEIKSNEYNLKDFTVDINAKDGSYEIKSNKPRLFGESSEGESIWNLKPFAKVPSYRLKYVVNKFYAEKMLAVYKEKKYVSGPLSLSMDINSQGTDWKSIVKNLDGYINITGDSLTFYGLDADEMLEQFGRSQNFSLLDLTGVLLAGPVGLLFTKGSDYAALLNMNQGESTKIIRLISNWTIIKGSYTIQDVAFTTEKNRLAIKGSINVPVDSLNLAMAVLDDDGCSKFIQEVSGKIDSPDIGSVKVVGTILAPVTNLYNDITGSGCDEFYKGSLAPPE